MSSELTTEERDRLLVRLSDLIGMEPVGIRVWVLSEGRWSPRGVAEGVCVHLLAGVQDEDGSTDYAVVYIRQTGAPQPPKAYPASTIDLDLADPLTADRCARWLAGRVGLACTEGYRWHASWRGFWELYATRPDASYARGEPTWFEVHVGDFSGARLTGPPPWAVPVPSLATLDPADPRTLPDGSRWVDRAALAEVIRHVGRSP